MSGAEILTVAQMAEADRLAVEAGVSSLALMENAGAVVADVVEKHYPDASILVLAGPGNNGGDGFWAAHHLRRRGYEVAVVSLSPLEELKGDAAEMAGRWGGPIHGFMPEVLNRSSLVVDAMFGAGLTRPLEGEAVDIVAAVKDCGITVLAVDVPSGMHGDLGHPLDGPDGVCMRAECTVTFFRKKPGHLLTPGRFLCGETIVADIGTPLQVLNSIRPRMFENGPKLWRTRFPALAPTVHKYQRGHTLVVSGPAHATGAARLAARGALRVGSGLVSVASPPESVAANAAHLTAIMIKVFEGPRGLTSLLGDKRLNAAVIGPGCGLGPQMQALVSAVLDCRTAAVLDADALTCFADDPGVLFQQLHENCVLTPHEGEFEALFPGLLENGAWRLPAAREAARRSGCTLVLKGPDTIVADPDGRAAINSNAPPTLATAGAGDVLAGMTGGLMAQGMDPFHAAACAVWLHGEAANRFGPGLIAEDIAEHLPGVLRALGE